MTTLRWRGTPPEGSAFHHAFDALDSTRKSSFVPSGDASTSISSPFENSPRRIFSESGSSMYFWIDRLSGRAPYASSYPFLTRSSVAASVSLMVS